MSHQMRDGVIKCERRMKTDVGRCSWDKF